MSIEVKKYNQKNEELAIRFGLGGIKAVGVSMINEVTKNRQKNNGKFKDIYDFSANAGAKAINKKAIEALTKAGAFDSIHKNRHQIVESVEIICKYASSKEEEKNSNQMSLFASAQIEEKNPDLKNVDEWNKEQKLQEEFKAFGFFLGEHPLDDFLDDLGKRGVISSEILEEIDDNNIIKLAGVVAYSKHKSGPKGRYAYLTLSDPFGIYETSIFSEELITTYRDKMVDGNILVVECLVKKDQGGSRILVKTIEELKEFIDKNRAKKEVYRDIRKQERRVKFDWKNKNQNQSPKDDIVAYEVEHKRKIAKLKQKSILKQIFITVNDRKDILRLKSFLSQKIAPADFDQFSKIYFIIKDQKQNPIKIELDEKYLISKEEIEKVGFEFKVEY